jgi:ribosomal protein S24E
MNIKDDIKKKDIIKFLNKKEEWFTLNQIKTSLGIHIYKAELLLYQLLYEGKVELDKRGKFNFWRLKNE